MPKKHYLTLAAACAIGLSGLTSAFAGTEVAATGKETKAVVTPPAPNYITGDFGVTFVSEYISRGVVQQTKGVIAQPYLDLYFKFYEGDGFLTSASAQLSLWADVGSNKSLAAPGNTVPNWYEFDWDPGISFVIEKSFTLTVSYYEFDSPASAFKTARSVNANLAYDDSGYMGAFALHPHFTVLYETGAPGFAGLKAHGWYYEIGIAPSYTFLKSSKYPLTFALPITVGLGDQSGFYGGNTFGYFSPGVTLAVPLAFIPPGYGTWTFTAGYSYYYLDKALRAASPSSHADSRHVFSGAIGCTF